MGTHGVLAEERDRAQPFEVDVYLDVDLRAAGASDDLADTLDYGTIATQVAALIAGESHALLERLASRIASELLADRRVASVTVDVRKLRPPVPVDLAWAGVRVVRP
jgi:dihydroneopterin aldolase